MANWSRPLPFRITLAWPPLEVLRKFRAPPFFVTVAFASVDELFMFTLEMFVMLALPAEAVPAKMMFELVIARFTLNNVPAFIWRMPEVPPPVMVCRTDELLTIPVLARVSPWKPRSIV